MRREGIPSSVLSKAKDPEMVNTENTVGVGLVPTHIVIASPEESGLGKLLDPPRLLRRLRLLATTADSQVFVIARSIRPCCQKFCVLGKSELFSSQARKKHA